MSFAEAYPSTVRGYIKAYINYLDFKDAHKDLSDWYTASYVAYAKMFGYRIDQCSTFDAGGIVARAAREYVDIHSPFDGYLAAPPAIQKLYEDHAERIGQAISVFRHAMMELACDAFMKEFEESRTFDWEDLVEAGHPTICPPCEHDYW